MVIWQLFITFFTIGFISFGGGYAMIPIIESEVSNHGWMTTQEFTDVIAVAGMSPGPIGTNSAIFVGYKTAGLPGAISATAGMVLPSLMIVIFVASFFYKMNENRFVKAAFYGLRPVITGLIFYGAIRFAISNQLIGDFSVNSVIMIGFFVVALVCLLYYRIHPLYVIVASGIVSVAIFS